jgi:hypothetical protein
MLSSCSIAFSTFIIYCFYGERSTRKTRGKLSLFFDVFLAGFLDLNAVLEGLVNDGALAAFDSWLFISPRLV